VAYLKIKFKDEKAGALGPGYDIDARLKKDARANNAKRFERVCSVEKNRRLCLGKEIRTAV